MCKRLWFVLGEYLQKASLYQIPFCFGIPTKKYVKILWFCITNYMNGADSFFVSFGIFFNFTAVLHAVDKVGAGENTGQGIVVLLGYGIVFVIVALGTCDREPEEGSGECIDLFRPFFGFHREAIAVVEFVAEPYETKCRQVSD